MNFHGIEAAIVNRDIGDLTGIKVKKIIFTEAGEGKGEVDMDNGLSKGGLQRCVCRPCTPHSWKERRSECATGVVEMGGCSDLAV